MSKLKRQGGIIVIDGPDGTGKSTTIKLVLELCRRRKPLGPTKFLSEGFPNYADFYGKQVRSYLDGDQASEERRVPSEIRQDPYCASLPYAADRYRTYTKVMKAKLDSGGWFILDRYISSNMAFQGAKIANQKEKRLFVGRLIQLEHGYFNLPKPDLVIILSLSETVRKKRTDLRQLNHLKKGGGQIGQFSKHDLHEQDLVYMAKVAAQYKALTKQFGWQNVDCLDNGRELTPTEVAERVYQVIRHRLLGN